MLYVLLRLVHEQISPLTHIARIDRLSDGISGDRANAVDTKHNWGQALNSEQRRRQKSTVTYGKECLVKCSQQRRWVRCQLETHWGNEYDIAMSREQMNEMNTVTR